jgi:hypothetical protein
MVAGRAPCSEWVPLVNGLIRTIRELILKEEAAGFLEKLGIIYQNTASLLGRTRSYLEIIMYWEIHIKLFGKLLVAWG